MSKKGTGSALSSATGGTSSGSSVVGSQNVAITSAHKRTRMSPEFIDLELKTTVPQCWEMRGFLEKYPLSVVENEKKIIRDMPPARRGEFLTSDISGLMRLVSTALELNEDSAGPSREVHALKEKISEQDAKITRLEIAVEDFEEKKKIWAETKTELRETQEKLKEAVEDNEKLKAAMAPGKGEGQFTRGATTRAQLVKQVDTVLGELTKAAKMGFNRVVEQLEVLNPGLVTDGAGFWRVVEDGRVVLPPKNADKEKADAEEAANVEEEEDDEMDQDQGPEHVVVDEEKDDGEEHQDESS
ncbi:hypothetical protein A2U01_0000471 [Trifolium medium]|uniref:Uncharacterized protein n=1 Tax=Trifolium medium TaxID=97028 RepID=A0A392LXQ3_9FABA|nr:hypothetical protein [Trifolium medium]